MALQLQPAGLPAHPPLDERRPEQQVAVVVVVVPGRRDRDRDDGARRQLFLDAGRVLMLWGWGGALAAATSAAGKTRPLDSSSAVHAFLAFVLWLIGVSLVALVPVAPDAFPRAARLGAAVANAVVHCFLAPWNVLGR